MSRTAMTEMDHMEMIWASMTCSDCEWVECWTWTIACVWLPCLHVNCESVMYGCESVTCVLCDCCLIACELWCTVCGCFILILGCFHSFIRICFNAWLQLLRRANCFKWLHVYRCFRFVLSIPDRNRHVPDRSIPFPISRNIEFVFPSGFPVPATVPGHIMQEREWLRCFPDRSRPFSTLQGWHQQYCGVGSRRSPCISVIWETFGTYVYSAMFH
jgi:hypothetical protein